MIKMAKVKSVYICRECGYESAKWAGKCPSCGEWNSMDETIKAPVSKSVSSSVAQGGFHLNSSNAPCKISDISFDSEHRYDTGLNELNRVLGGGLVKGSLVLLGGAPGIGKSTILLQICEYLARNLSILYISGEESKRQLKMRATRLGVDDGNLYFMTETDVGIIIESIRQQKPDIVIIDSIQTMSIAELTSSPGSITQVRESTNAFMHIAKDLDISMIVVGHVNKDGAIAGPKVLEHIVDTVLYFEGDKQLSYRMLRAVKNRYGSTNEIGVFDMLDDGLQEVENPSMMLLSGRPKDVSGTCVSCLMEGTRPLLAEVQGLACETGFGNPRRMSTGFDYNRLSLLLAVLEKRAGYYFSNVDTYVNVIGGIRLDEPAADLSVALALISSLKDIIIPEDTLAFGEIGLTGELRMVSGATTRISEAKRMGFKKCIVPYHNLKKLSSDSFSGIEIVGARNIRQAFESV